MLKIEHDMVAGHLRLASAEPKIGDFGLSCLALGGPFSQTAMCGSRYWMSPEMIQRVGYGLKTDIYSLGCVMFELMVGRAPYRRQGGLLAIFYHATKGCDSLPKEDADFYTKDCLDFWRRLVVLNPRDREDASSLLKHKWLNSKRHLPSVLGEPLNTAYDNFGPHFKEALLRPKWRDRFHETTKQKQTA
eukprot:TRINITY_DN15240_c0_g2_i4.p1 TRINITY_DN15240_c0_g2~~TRINITY_DN15240_c0_g2_i4.p1  ORF type:complete len:189 (+),score=26.54 TRINITY_DN15240_c0_g2_i4:1045-1611(+)